MKVGEFLNYCGRSFVAVKPDDPGWCGSCSGIPSNNGNVYGLCHAVGDCENCIVVPTDEDYQI